MRHTKTPINIWIAECFSCQVDLIDLIKSSPKLSSVKVFSSHTIEKNELKKSSDFFQVQPPIRESGQWLLDQCIKNNVSLLFCGKKGVHVEHLREEFARNNIVLVTGASEVETHHLLDDKYKFTQICNANNIQVVPAHLVNNRQELIEAIELTKSKFVNVCAKPVFGVYGFGFVRLDDQVSKFRHIEDPLICNTQLFIDSYAEETNPRPYLIMPFIENEECSVDIACSHGEVISKVTRVKYEDHQQCYVNGECDEMAIQLVKLFELDGLINIQFKKHIDGHWYALEINNRPSGGFYYTQHTGINLIEDLICKKLNIENIPTTTPADAVVRTRIVSYKDAV